MFHLAITIKLSLNGGKVRILDIEKFRSLHLFVKHFIWCICISHLVKRKGVIVYHIHAKHINNRVKVDTVLA